MKCSSLASRVFITAGGGRREWVRRMQGRDVLGMSHVCLHQLTRTRTWMGGTAHTALGFPHRRSGCSMALAQGSCLSLLGASGSIVGAISPHPFPAACPGDVPVTVTDQLRAHPSHPHLADRVPAGLTRRWEMVKAGALANESIALNGEGRSHFSTTAHGTGGPWPWREALMG